MTGLTEKQIPNNQIEINGFDIEETRRKSFRLAKRRGASVDQAEDFSSYVLMFLVRRGYIPKLSQLMYSFMRNELGEHKPKGCKRAFRQRESFEDRVNVNFSMPSPEYNPNNYKFTDAQRLLISLVAQGYHLQDLPKLSGLSRFTVKETIDSIYKFLGAKRPPKGKPLIKVERPRKNHKDVASTCHPEKKVKGYGYCRACYMKHYRAGTLPGKRNWPKTGLAKS